MPSLRLLGREGFNITDVKTFATLAVLHNHDVFAAGAQLIGSHAYGVLLNHLGVRSSGYSTQDNDLLVPSPDEAFPTVAPGQPKPLQPSPVAAACRHALAGKPTSTPSRAFETHAGPLPGPPPIVL